MRPNLSRQRNPWASSSFARPGKARTSVAGWGKFMHELGIEGQPIGAKNLRELLVAEGINPKLNEFSQGIIAMREE